MALALGVAATLSGAQISSSAAFVVPTVRAPPGVSVEMNPQPAEGRVNEGYASLLGRGGGHANMRAQLQEARWLLKSLEIRQETLLKVARSIIERQAAFLEHGEEHMRPMILRDIADAIGMHESTISRVTSGKYMHTPRGVFELTFSARSRVRTAPASRPRSAPNPR
jgi:RNA polymerase sigma-54 factor